jgi:hypothetical protein
LLDGPGKIVVRYGRGDEPNAPTIDRTLPVERGDGGVALVHDGTKGGGDLSVKIAQSKGLRRKQARRFQRGAVCLVSHLLPSFAAASIAR